MPKKTNTDLQRFTKANQAYKLKLAQAAGFRTIEEYRAALGAKKGHSTPRPQEPRPQQAAQPTGTPRIHIVNIVDASDSMRERDASGAPKIEAAMQAVVADISLVKQGIEGVSYTYSLFSFSSSGDVQSHIFMVPPEQLGEAPTIRPRNMTALYKAVGDILTDLNKVIPDTDKVVVTICTDGQENHSRGSKWANRGVLADFITDLENKGYTITFIGTDRDTKAAIDNLGIHESNTRSYDGTTTGLMFANTARTEALTNYSTNVLKGKSVKRGFYKEVVKIS